MFVIVLNTTLRFCGIQLYLRISKVELKATWQVVAVVALFSVTYSGEQSLTQQSIREIVVIFRCITLVCLIAGGIKLLFCTNSSASLYYVWFLQGLSNKVSLALLIQRNYINATMLVNPLPPVTPLGTREWVFFSKF